MQNSSSGVQSVERIFSIIEILAKHPKGASLQEITEDSTLAKSTVHRLLQSLIFLGYVVQDSNTLHYRLTFKMFELSSSIVHEMDVLSIAKPHIDRVARQTGEAVHFVLQDEKDIIYVYKAEGAGGHMLRMGSHVGRRTPMYCTGVGKAILATNTYAQVEKIWQKSNIKALTEKTVVNLDEFILQLKKVKMQGFAIDDEENEIGVRCVAFSLPSLNGRAEAAFSFSGPASRMTDARIEELAIIGMNTKYEIIKDLGWK